MSPARSPEDAKVDVRHVGRLADARALEMQTHPQLAEERAANGRFRDGHDLMARLGTRVINKRLLESLARAGALDTLEPNRHRLVDGAEVLLRYAAAAADAAQSDQASLFGDSGAAQVPKPPLPAVEDWPALERLQMEFDVLGLFLSAHPLDGYRNALQRLGVITGGPMVIWINVWNSPAKAPRSTTAIR